MSEVLIDDRLLVGVLVGEPHRLPAGHRNTTTYWYYRACRAAAAGGAGALAGPFRSLPPEQQAAAIAALLALPDELGLPDPRVLVPVMADVSRRHPHLNVMNVEATAAAIALDALVVLSEPAAEGVLPAVLDAERIRWRAIRSRRRPAAR